MCSHHSCILLRSHFPRSRLTTIQCLAWLYVYLRKVQVFVTQLRKGWLVGEPGKGSARLHGSFSIAAPALCMRLENAVTKSGFVFSPSPKQCVWRERARERLGSVEITHQIEFSAGRPIGHGRLQGEGEQ